MTSRHLAALCVTLVALTVPAAAQAPPAAPPARPTVGVAFGGGSARGIAHVGIIRWFEEHRIPIDMAAGTSMGGLIGALYAMGKSPAEMEALIDESIQIGRLNRFVSQRMNCVPSLVI